MMADDCLPAVGNPLFEVARFSHLALLRSLGHIFQEQGSIDLSMFVSWQCFKKNKFVRYCVIGEYAK
ncbi:hypothetical protein D3C86_2209950 [compost metagenome]